MSTLEPITIRYRWDRRNFDALLEHAYLFLFAHSYRRYVGWFFIALLQFGIVAAMKQRAFGLLLFSSITVFYWYFVKKWIAHRRALASFDHSPLKGEQIELVADEEGLRGKEGHWPREKIDEVRAIDDAILIRVASQFYYLPESAFDSIESRSAFKRLAREKGKLISEKRKW
jgi:hypothetical protein